MPLSLAWIDERVVLATEAGSVTAGNITSQGGAWLGLGPTRDVEMIDAELEHVYSLDEVCPPGSGTSSTVGTRRAASPWPA